MFSRQQRRIALDTWSICARRMGLIKDIRVLISRLVETAFWDGVVTRSCKKEGEKPAAEKEPSEFLVFEEGRVVRHVVVERQFDHMPPFGERRVEKDVSVAKSICEFLHKIHNTLIFASCDYVADDEDDSDAAFIPLLCLDQKVVTDEDDHARIKRIIKSQRLEFDVSFVSVQLCFCHMGECHNEDSYELDPNRYATYGEVTDIFRTRGDGWPVFELLRGLPRSFTPNHGPPQPVGFELEPGRTYIKWYYR